MSYESVKDMPREYSFNMWESITQINVGSFNLAESPFSITHNNTLMKFITQNSLNSVLTGLLNSTQAIMDESMKARTKNN